MVVPLVNPFMRGPLVKSMDENGLRSLKGCAPIAASRYPSCISRRSLLPDSQLGTLRLISSCGHAIDGGVMLLLRPDAGTTP